VYKVIDGEYNGCLAIFDHVVGEDFVMAHVRGGLMGYWAGNCR
jgi:hypothetical protein